jgi:hypothetical protein
LFLLLHEIALARKVKLRPWLDLQPAADGTIDPAARTRFTKKK